MLNELNIGPNRHKITKLAVMLAMDRHNPQRELISRLISDLYSGLLTQDDIARGFDELLVSLDDLQLDTPDAHTVRTLKMFCDVTGFYHTALVYQFYGKICRLYSDTVEHS